MPYTANDMKNHCRLICLVLGNFGGNTSFPDDTSPHSTLRLFTHRKLHGVVRFSTLCVCVEGGGGWGVGVGGLVQGKTKNQGPYKVLGKTHIRTVD